MQKWLGGTSVGSKISNTYEIQVYDYSISFSLSRISRYNACNGGYSALHTHSSSSVALRIYVALCVLYRATEIEEAPFNNYSRGST